MMVCPVVVGAGKRFFPDRVRLNLELVEERRFRHGVVVPRYAVRLERVRSHRDGKQSALSSAHRHGISDHLSVLRVRPAVNHRPRYAAGARRSVPPQRNAT
jgi:hypothetical protein